MSGADFLDTNVLVYAYQFNQPEKQRIARDLVKQAVAGKFVISAQVLSELSSTLLHKFFERVPPRAMKEILERLSPIRVIAVDAEIVLRAVEAHKSYGLHFYDGLIIAAAERAGCKRIWSEDFNAGQTYFGVGVANPFV